jgi:hypothetical protein
MAIASWEWLRSQDESVQTSLSSQDVQTYLALSRKLSSKQQGIFSQAMNQNETLVPFNSDLMAMATEMRRTAWRARDERD